MSNTVIYIRAKNPQPLPANAALQLPRRGAPIGAISYSLESNYLHVGYSLLNPKDRWDRNRAREMAVARLNSRRMVKQEKDAQGQTVLVRIEEPHYFALETPAPTEGTFRPYDAVRRIYEALQNGEVKAPARLQRALKSMLAENENRVRILAELSERSTAYCEPLREAAPVSSGF